MLESKILQLLFEVGHLRLHVLDLGLVDCLSKYLVHVLLAYDFSILIIYTFIGF